MYADMGKAERTPIPHTNGRIETDRSFIDAAVDSKGRWWVLRANSLTCYQDATLSTVTNFIRFEIGVTSDALLRFLGEVLMVKSGRNIRTVDIPNSRLVSTPYNVNETIYEDAVTGLKVIKDIQGVNVRIRNEPFVGKCPLPF